MFTNPITQKNHRKWDILHTEIGKNLTGYIEGDYEEIVKFTTKDIPIPARKILSFFRPALEEEYIDLDSKGRGSCLNHDLYAYDPNQAVAIIQARMYYKRAASHYGATRKTYFLCGRNEITHDYFRHPVSSHAVRAACKTSIDKTRADVVKKIQMWMWEVTKKQLEKSIRQGDILLVPEREPKKAKYAGLSFSVAESHKILADEIRLNGHCYAKNPRMIHIKNQHAPVELLDGWYSIRVGRETKAWDFAERIGD